MTMSTFASGSTSTSPVTVNLLTQPEQTKRKPPATSDKLQSKQEENMKFDKLRVMPVALVVCVGIVVLVVSPVTSFQNCPRECPQEFNLICGFNAAKNCYRVFENNCAVEMVNCYRPRTYAKTDMEDCGDPASWCVNKNVND